MSEGASGKASERQDTPAETCRWCGDAAVTHVITRKGSKNRATAPVCEEHAVHFERQGIETVRQEAERKQNLTPAQIRRRENLRRNLGE